MFFSTGSLFQYFRPSQSLRLAGFVGTPTLSICSLPRAFSVASPPSTLNACHGSFCSFRAMWSSSSGSGCDCRRKGFGGEAPPRVTEERKPSRCRPRTKFTCILETGIDVRPRRAFDAFCRCEHTCARFTSDMLAVLMRYLPSRGCDETKSTASRYSYVEQLPRYQMSVFVVMQAGGGAAIARAVVDE
jgi:hypothetical protein